MIKVIAEIGINHNGEKEKALRLIEHASYSNCWAVKFQYRSGSFFATNDEMGSTLIREELQKSELQADWIPHLIKYSKELGLKVGFSFFRNSDLEDFFDEKNFNCDFIKIPSPEFRNLSLISKAKQYKPIMISYGGGEENEIRRYIELSGLNEKDVVLHCISNYPTAIGNQQLEFLERLNSFSDAVTGYSSHDEDWEINLIAAQYGIRYIERHICESKSDKGLDISTSSSPEEFKRLNRLLQNYDIIKYSSKRTPNQGEILNVRNLGTSLYAKKKIMKGTNLLISDFDEKSPRVGISKDEFKMFENTKLASTILKGEPLTKNNFKLIEKKISPELKNFSVKNMLSLPVRLHDFKFIKNRFGFNNYEFHLSYKEIFELDRSGFESILKMVSDSERYSIHLPDYISKDDLIDPFSNNKEIKSISENIISTSIQLALELEEKTGKKCLILGSFSMNNFKTKDEFYENFKEYIDNKIKTYGIEIIAQWLPKKAWYFGGTIEVDLFSSSEDIDFCIKHKIPVCLDIAHLILSANYYKANWKSWYIKLIPLSKHIHLSDAEGTDGEGVKFGEGEIHSINEILNLDCIKVLEIWEGHLNHGEGFEEGIKYLLNK